MSVINTPCNPYPSFASELREREQRNSVYHAQTFHRITTCAPESTSAVCFFHYLKFSVITSHFFNLFPFLINRTCTQMVCRDCIVLAHSKLDGHDLQELNEVKAEYVLNLEQLRIKVEDSIRQRQGHLSCLRAELDTMDIVNEVACAEADKLFDQLVEVVNARRQQVSDCHPINVPTCKNNNLGSPC